MGIWIFLYKGTSYHSNLWYTHCYHKEINCFASRHLVMRCTWISSGSLLFPFLLSPGFLIFVCKTLTKWNTGVYLSTNNFVSLTYQMFIFLAQVQFFVCCAPFNSFLTWHLQCVLVSVSSWHLSLTFPFTSHCLLVLLLNILLFTFWYT